MNKTMLMVIACGNGQRRSRPRPGAEPLCDTCGEETTPPDFKHLPTRCALCAIRDDIASNRPLPEARIFDQEPAV